MPEYDVIEKGEYLHPQKGGSIPVNTFLFIRENGKKYLLLSFTNPRKSVLTGLSLEITQLNGQSKVIGEKSVKYGNLKGKPKQQYVLTHKIEVDESCEDVIVNVAEALYGHYAYTVSGGQEKIEYIAPPGKFDIAGAVDEMCWQNVRVSERTVRKRIILGVFSCLLVVLVLALTFMQLKKFEQGRTTFIYNGVEYAFADDDTSDGTDIFAVGSSVICRDVTIPSEIEGHKVIKVAREAFKSNPRITSLTVESDIPIEDGAFADCKNLKTLNIEDVTSIGVGAFENCTSLDSFVCTNLDSVGKCAFMGCTALTSADISHGFKRLVIGDSAFAGCTELAFVNIAQPIVYPETGLVFVGCTGMTGLKLKNFANYVDGKNDKPLTSLFGAADGSQLKLETVVIDNLEIISRNFLKSAPVVNFTAGNLKYTVVGESAFEGTNLAELRLPVNITEVGDSAFRNSKLSEFDADELEYAGDYAFYGTALTGVNGAALTHIGSYAFSGCSALTSATFDNCTYLGSGAFANTALTSVTYPDNLNYVPDSAFMGCTSLDNISLANGVVGSVGVNAFYGCTALKDVAVPNTVKSIGMSAFGGTSLESISVPFIGGSERANTFLGYIFGSYDYRVNSFPKTLQRVNLTYSKIIPDNALYGCSTLREFIFPQGISHVGASAFENCTSLKSITVPQSTAFVGKKAFAGCTALENITLPFAGSGEAGNNFFGFLFGASKPEDSEWVVPSLLSKVTLTKTAYLPANAFAGCKYLKTVDLTPSALISIGYDAFANCQSLKNVYLPESLTAINDRAFYNCIRLSEFTIPSAVTLFGEEVFGQCFRLYEIKNFSVIPNEAITAVNVLKVYNPMNEEFEKFSVSGYVIGRLQGVNYLLSYPEGEANLTLPSTEYGYKLSNHLFYADATVKSVILPACVSDAGVYTFNGCSALKSVIFEDGCAPENINEYLFMNCFSLVSIDLPDSVTAISEFAFYCCRSLTTVKFGSGLINIGTGAFYGCEKLSYADLPEGIKSIGRSAFENCTALKEAVIPSTLTSLGARAFAGCKSLSRLEIKDGLTSVQSETFSGNENLTEVILSGSIREIGDGAFYNTAIKYLTLPEGLTRVGENAFADNASLLSVVIPQSLKSIGAFAFRGCTNLYLVYNLGDIPIKPNSYEYGCVAQNAIAVAASLSDAEYVENNVVTYLRYLTSWYVVGCENSVTTLELSRFYHNGEIVNSFSIYDRAFANNDKLEMVILRGEITSIGREAFANCYSLSSVHFGARIEDIGESAFVNCSQLKSININLDSLKSIGRYAFAGCVELSSAELPEALTVLPDGIFSGDGKLEKFDIPSGVTSIGSDAFNGCSSLKTVTLPDGLTYIGQYAFCGCSGIESITIPQSVQTISEQAFYGCNSLFIVYNLSSLDIVEHGRGNGMAGYYAVKIFTDVNQKADFKTVNSSRFVRIENEWYLFRYDGSLFETVCLPESFNYNGETVSEYTIKNYAFSGVNGIVIPKAVKAIQPYAFREDGKPAYGVAVYYGGNYNEWINFRPENFYAPNVYYYTECVHDTDKWTYDGAGRVSTALHLHGLELSDVKNATCTEDGYEGRTCPNCRRVIFTVIGKTGHTVITDKEKKPTCTESGLTEGSHCNQCGEIIKEQETIPATGHNFDDDGTCTVCGTKRE